MAIISSVMHVLLLRNQEYTQFIITFDIMY